MPDQADAQVPQHYHHAEIGSTNTEAMRLGSEGEAHGTAVSADHQTAGRGQPGRKWWMPPGKGILLSVLLRELPPGLEFDQLTVHVGRLLAELLADETGLKIDIKLPNDLLINGKKVAGILCEANWRGMNLEYLVIGVGIDVNVSTFPDELREQSTSLLLETGAELDRDDLLKKVIERLRKL